MTYDQFYQALEEKTQADGAHWSQNIDEEIRYGTHCPLSFVANTEPGNVNKAKPVLRMTDRALNRIAGAADNQLYWPSDTVIRQRLLKATGLVP